jgi:spore germination protein
VVRKLVIAFLGLVLGLVIGIFLVFHTTLLPLQFRTTKAFGGREVIGFLPYWLIGKAQAHYSNVLTTLAYFSLSLGEDGSVRKLTNPQETEPGWYTLSSGKFTSFLSTAKADNVKLSLVVFCADHDTIGAILADPVSHADNLTADVIPVMQKYGFTDLNLDMEYGGEASPAARLAYMQFIARIKERLIDQSKYTLTVEISPSDLIRPGLTDLKRIGEIADHVILMTYDYHYAGSSVTGAVAPLGGAGVSAEYDTETAVQNALAVIPAKKVILGIPLYGYEWETIAIASHSAVIPGTGLTASNRRIEDLLHSCASCSAHFDTDAQEAYLVYRDSQTGTYHQITFPDKQAVAAKVSYATQEKLGGIGLWALGYEGSTELSPLTDYKNKY